jgi:hypothetical protein
MARPKKRGLKGAGQVRRMLRQMPDAVQTEIVDLYRRTEAPALAIARGGAPVRTGALRAALGTKILPRSLRFQVGLIGKRVSREFFYGRILEVGRKAKTVSVRRSTSQGVSAYALRVSAIPAVRYDIVQGRARARIRQLIVDPLQNLWDKALRRAALGAGDD